MKTKADIVIIGAGMSGCSIAYNLAKRGAKNIVVLEKGFICSGSTGACGAGFRMQWGTEMNCRMSKFSTEFFEHANDILEYDGDIELRQSGYLMIADTEKELTQFRKNIEVQHACGIPSRMVSLEEAKEIVPHLNTDILSGAAYCQKDGFLNPHKTTDAFYKAAKRLGVETNKGYIETPIVVNEHPVLEGLEVVAAPSVVVAHEFGRLRKLVAIESVCQALVACARDSLRRITPCHQSPHCCIGICFCSFNLPSQRVLIGDGGTAGRSDVVLSVSSAHNCL